MAHKYAEIVFTDKVKQVQAEQGSRSNYTSMEHGEDYNFLMSLEEAAFIESRDSFYVASVSETCWPYVQHRGGPAGFVKVLDASTIGFADFTGNRQYVSTGNFRTNNRVALFFMDYPNRRRLKMMGLVEQVREDDWNTQAKLEVEGYGARVERAFLIHIQAFDWNCPQHITPRYTEHEIEQQIAPLLEENRQLKILQKEQLQILQKEMFTASMARQEHLKKKSHQMVGSVQLSLTISGIRQLCRNVRAYELKTFDSVALPEFEAGAHLKIKVPLDNGDLVIRHYSICSNPQRRDIYEIAVLDTETEQSASTVIHETFALGAQIQSDLPENYFSLHKDSRPAVLIAGGIGITPIMSMAHALLTRGSHFHLHYAGRTLKDMPFRAELEQTFSDQITIYPSEHRKLDVMQIMQTSPADAVFYVCGPNSLINAVRDSARILGIDENRVQLERFDAGNKKALHPFAVHLDNSEKVIHVSETQSLLDALLAEGVNVPFSCKAGACKSCVVRVLEGDVDHHDNCLTNTERTEQSLMCACVSRARSDSLMIELKQP